MAGFGEVVVAGDADFRKSWGGGVGGGNAGPAKVAAGGHADRGFIHLDIHRRVGFDEDVVASMAGYADIAVHGVGFVFGDKGGCSFAGAEAVAQPIVVVAKIEAGHKIRIGLAFFRPRDFGAVVVVVIPDGAVLAAGGFIAEKQNRNKFLNGLARATPLIGCGFISDPFVSRQLA